MIYSFVTDDTNPSILNKSESICAELLTLNISTFNLPT